MSTPEVLLVYDARLGEARPATQPDLDFMEASLRNHFFLYSYLKDWSFELPEHIRAKLEGAMIAQREINQKFSEASPSKETI